MKDLWNPADMSGRRISEPQNSYVICLFVQNVNTLIVVKVLECTHASTVERRLPQLRGSGIGLGRCCGTNPHPHPRPCPH